MKREGSALELEGTACAKGLCRDERGREKACALELVEAFGRSWKGSQGWARAGPREPRERLWSLPCGAWCLENSAPAV